VTELKLRRERVGWRPVADGQIIALDGSSSEYLAVNESGTILWRALATGATREELAALLVRECGLSADAAARAVGAFVSSLDERDLLVRSQPER